MTQAALGNDLSRGVIFDWSVGDEVSYEYEIVPELENWTDNVFLSFRVCQGTRHPETVALAGTLNFTVTLEDGNGTTSSINFASYGSITRTYLRGGLGTGLGWANEFNTVRIRVVDFENNDSGIDLADIKMLRYEFGEDFGSSRGRIGVDDVELTFD